MSFDVFFEPCRYDGTTERRVNPFTKQVQEIPNNRSLTDREVEAVMNVLDRAGARAPDDQGCRAVRFPDGGSAEIFTNDCARRCMVSIHDNVTPSLAQLLFDVMVAGDWVIIPAGSDADGVGDEDVVVAPSTECVANAPSFYGRVVVAESAAGLNTLLEAR